MIVFNNIHIHQSPITTVSKADITNTRKIMTCLKHLTNLYFPVIIILMTILVNNYIIYTNYTPDLFGHDKLIKKSYRCIRYYQNGNDYNKYMEKSCIPYIKDNQAFSEAKSLYTQSNIILTLFGVMALTS